MATGVVATGRKHVSELIKGTTKFEDESGVNYYYARVNVKGSGDVDPIGTPLVWNNATTAFNVFVAQDLTATEVSSLPDGSLTCVTVGAKEGIGFNKEDVTLSGTDTEMTVIFRGPAQLVNEGFDWGTANDANQTLFKRALEIKGASVAESVTTVVPSYVS